MTKNMGTADRTAGMLLALVIAVLYLMHTISGTLAIVLGLGAVFFFATSLVGWCPAYLPFALSTRRGSAGPRPPAQNSGLGNAAERDLMAVESRYGGGAC